MASKEDSTITTPLVQKEKIRVAVRIRPMEYYGHEGRSSKILKVLNRQTLVLTELPINNDKVSLEHHFQPGTPFRPQHTHWMHSQIQHHHGQAIGGGQRHALNNPHRDRRHNLNLLNGFHHHSYGQQQQPNVKHHHYQFDHIFDESSTQEEVYQTVAAPLIPSVFEGIYVTIFAYGATNSGKTHTMIGTIENPGIMARAIDDIFQMTENIKVGGDEFHVETSISYLEVYNEQIRDLLVPSSAGVHLELLEDDKDQVRIAGLSEIRVTSTNEVLNFLHKGNRARTVEATFANQTSSRSHAILIVTVRQRTSSEATVEGNSEGKLYLIDLAGSERASVTKNSGARLREGAHINRSLLALGNCITALASGKLGEKYVNYRDSKLTRLLKPALGGPSRTAMIAHVNPIPSHREETRNTLVYASRTRSISNNVMKFRTRGHIPSDVESLLMKDDSFNIIKDLKNEVKRLTLKLEEERSRPSTFPDQQTTAMISGHTTGSSDLSSPASTSSPDVKDPVKSYYKDFVRSNIPLEDRPNLGPMKREIVEIFKKEAQLRSELLKIDGAMLQSALDCEIMRLMMLDWQHPKNGSSETEGSLSSLDDMDLNMGSQSGLHSLLLELNQKCKEQEKLLYKKTNLQGDMKAVRERIEEIESSAFQYLPDVQREILSLLCKLQQKQIQTMSSEIEAELKRRSKLLLRCIRQKALGEAVIHRQRNFLNAIAGDLQKNDGRKQTSVSDNADDMYGDVLPRLLPSRKASSTPRRWSSSQNNDCESRERIFHTPPPQTGRRSTATLIPAPLTSPTFDNEEIHLPKLENASYPTTKYSDVINLERQHNQPQERRSATLPHNEQMFSRSSSKIVHRDLGLLLR